MEWIMDKYNIKELEEKINRCKNMKLEDINPDEVDELTSIKIDRRKSSEERILDLQIKKKQLSDKLIDGEVRNKDLLSTLSKDDIKELLANENKD